MTHEILSKKAELKNLNDEILVKELEYLLEFKKKFLLLVEEYPLIQLESLINKQINWSVLEATVHNSTKPIRTELPNFVKLTYEQN